MVRQYHLQIEDGDVAPIVLLPGDPARVPIIASFWDDARHLATNREYTTYTGTYKGVPISATSTGIGAPSMSLLGCEIVGVLASQDAERPVRARR